jgi:hypothetical protein
MILRLLGLPHTRNTLVGNALVRQVVHRIGGDLTAGDVHIRCGRAAAAYPCAYTLQPISCIGLVCGCRGVSGGERKRVTSAEMLVGHSRILAMDEISTGLVGAGVHEQCPGSGPCACLPAICVPAAGVFGPHCLCFLRRFQNLVAGPGRACRATPSSLAGMHLSWLPPPIPPTVPSYLCFPSCPALQDSATLFSICTYLKQATNILGNTMVISLLQPPPEVMMLFEDIILMTEG